jgi:hypothetical protein
MCETTAADYQNRIRQIQTARDETERALMQALEAMLDTALATDDAAWSRGIERAGTSRPCDAAVHALAWVQGAGFDDIVMSSRFRRMGKTVEEARRKVRAMDAGPHV